jgi:hypothetical protein
MSLWKIARERKACKDFLTTSEHCSEDAMPSSFCKLIKLNNIVGILANNFGGNSAQLGNVEYKMSLLQPEMFIVAVRAPSGPKP